MKRELTELARDLKAYIADQDDTLLEPVMASKSSNAAVNSVDDLLIESQRNNSIIAAEKAADYAGKSVTDEAVNIMKLDNLKEKIINCRECPLGNYRISPVFGVGNANAKVMFVGEGPGFEEDHKGEPFVGRSGKLLDKIMETVLGLNRGDVYIANIVKCHPMKDPSNPEAHSNDRPPTLDEISACKHYLDEQIKIIKPLCIVPLGSVAAKVLLNSDHGISLLRGKIYDYHVYVKGMPDGIKVIPTYHPAALLRNPNLKRDTWQDMKMLKALLDSSL